jgi:hypothetical protein
MISAQRDNRDAPVVVNEVMSDAERDAAHAAIAHIDHDAAQEQLPDVEATVGFVRNFLGSALILASAAGMVFSSLNMQYNRRMLAGGVVLLFVGGLLLLYKLRVWHRRTLD